MNITDKIRESNRIEGIHREPTQTEIDIHLWFLTLDKIEISDLENFVNIYQPNAKLRVLPAIAARAGNVSFEAVIRCQTSEISKRKKKKKIHHKKTIR